VINFFTESAYGPRLLSGTASTVSVIRAREDHEALVAISPKIRIKAGGLLDAPLRLNISPRSVCQANLPAGEDAETFEKLRAIARANRNSLVLAPLGLGNHVDHLATRDSAIENFHASHLALYEDLPYATWSSEAEIQERVAATAQKGGMALQPVIIRGEHAVWRKGRLIRLYQSQITGGDATHIARFALKYGGGERIWIPKRGPWRSFVNRYA
jgi:LmbE family N-acetylglucosaminyl deacetylase